MNQSYVNIVEIEIKENNKDKAIWAKAIALSNGDEDKANKKYLGALNQIVWHQLNLTRSQQNILKQDDLDLIGEFYKWLTQLKAIHGYKKILWMDIIDKYAKEKGFKRIFLPISPLTKRDAFDSIR